MYRECTKKYQQRTNIQKCTKTYKNVLKIYQHAQTYPENKQNCTKQGIAAIFASRIQLILTNQCHE